ncbi:hypothetical protein [Massilia sp. CF038]|uniref:hypothetical protein n=1 Tax=Massilia sp. CF038 TaxID=1881045 RepID=UPI000910B746|nr:hypothetical protein [Massilia sp. CF038]SHH03150.1 hypothetical protein SAMN05428948_2419 [Massilia sp. CF038]
MSLFGLETPMERPSPGKRAAVFVPKSGGDQAGGGLFQNGSGMVGYRNPDGTMTIYFENNRFNDSALHSWQNKVFKAYDRLVNGSPTVNKTSCDATSVVQIGFVQGPEILVIEMPQLTDWLTRSNALDSAPEGPNIHA